MNDDIQVEYRPTIHDLPQGERPRERLEHYGAGALSSAAIRVPNSGGAFKPVPTAVPPIASSHKPPSAPVIAL